MSYGSMWQELLGTVPKLAPDYSATIVNRAWRDIRRQNLWSFLMFESNWTSPSIINAGTVATTQGANTVVFNAAAATAINAQALGPPTPITQRQFRIGVGTIYNIWQWDNATMTATLDRNYQEASAATASYQIFQCYYPAPIKDFWAWLNIRDIVNFNDLIYTMPRSYFDRKDPQRLIGTFPSHCAGYQYDLNPASNTQNYMMFELALGQPQYPITWQLAMLRKGNDFVNDTDELPPAIGEDALMAKSRALAYEWASANQGDNPRDQGPDYKFLMQGANAEYTRLYREYRRQDRELVDNFFTCRKTRWSWANWNGYFNSLSRTASPGPAW